MVTNKLKAKFNMKKSIDSSSTLFVINVSYRFNLKNIINFNLFNNDFHF